MNDVVNIAKSGSPAVIEHAENELRVRAKSLYKQIETTYWELGAALYEIYDGLPGGYRDLMKGDGSRAERAELFRKWGYKSFEEYCDKEIGIKPRSASSLRYAYWWFEVKLQLPLEMKLKVKNLGRSKVYILSGFVTEDDCFLWVEKAENMTCEELKKAVQMAKAIREGKPLPNDGLPNSFEETRKLDEDGPPPPETTRNLSTSLYEGQWNTWNDALQRAKSVTGSDKISHNLEMICMDFLATNDFKKPEDDKKAYLAKIEKQLGVRLIAIDAHTGKPVYNINLLWSLIEEGQDKQTEMPLDQASVSDDNTPETPPKPTVSDDDKVSF